MSTQTKWIILAIGVVLIAVIAFFVAPVEIFIGQGVDEQGNSFGGGAETDWGASTVQFLFFTGIWLAVWLIGFIALPKLFEKSSD